MILLITVVMAVVISVVVMAVLVSSKQSYYRRSVEDVQRLLQWVLLGQANEDEWRIFCGIPIHYNPELDEIRQRCAVIDEAHFLGDNRSGCMLDKAGAEALRGVLADVESLIAQKAA